MSDVAQSARTAARRARKLAVWLWRGMRAKVLLARYRRTGQPVPDVSTFARRPTPRDRRVYSQNGEDGILAAIFAVIGTTNRYFVEFGVEDGVQCNTRHLTRHGRWSGLLMDGAEPALGSNVRRAFVTAENVEALFATYGVPARFDLLSIDIDGNDYWVWKAISKYRPRVTVIEYNSSRPPLPAVSVPYDPLHVWDHTAWFGASLGALEKLGREKGYKLIATDPNGVNAFFVEDSFAHHFSARSLQSVYHPPSYYGVPGRAHAPDTQGRSWIGV